MKEEHKEHLKIALQELREHQLFTKFSKCDFFKDKIQYLGHVMTIRENLGSKIGLIRKCAKIGFCELEFKNQ